MEKRIDDVGELRDVKAAIELLRPRILCAGAQAPKPGDLEYEKYQDYRPELAQHIGKSMKDDLWIYFEDPDVRCSALEWVQKKINASADTPRRGLIQLELALKRLRRLLKD